MRVKLTLVILLSIAFLPFAFTEEPERGRLPDGRAFRTDASGNQLVDYVAELELSVEALTRRVQGLEDELREKNTAIERLQRGESAGGKLEERDLINSKGQVAQTSFQAPSASELALRDERDLLAKEVNDLKENVTKLSNQVSEKERALSAATSEKEASLEEVSELRARLDAREATSVNKEDGQDALRDNLVQANEQSLQSAKIQRSAPEVSISPALPFENIEARASLSTARLRAIESVRGSLLTEINKVNGLLATRDRAYVEFAKSKRNVSFRPSAPISSRKRSLQGIKKESNNAQSVYALSELRREVNEIRAKAQDDMALMKRLN